MSNTEDKILCFKQTRHMHESGYRYIEYGYIDNNGIVEVVGRYDIIQTPYNVALPYHLDLTKSGWFRILPRKDLKIQWGYGGEVEIKGELND